MESLKHEIARLEMRSEQLRIHLRSVPGEGAEARRVRSLLSAMRTKVRALRRFARTAGAMGRNQPTLH
jgi:hypothetical protein